MDKPRHWNAVILMQSLKSSFFFLKKTNKSITPLPQTLHVLSNWKCEQWLKGLKFSLPAPLPFYPRPNSFPSCASTHLLSLFLMPAGPSHSPHSWIWTVWLTPLLPLNCCPDIANSVRPVLTNLFKMAIFFYLHTPYLPPPILIP